MKNSFDSLHRKQFASYLIKIYLRTTVDGWRCNWYPALDSSSKFLNWQNSFIYDNNSSFFGVILIVDLSRMEKQKWAAWKQQQTMKQLAAFKLDVQSPIKNHVRSHEILQSQKQGNTQNSEEMLKSGVLTKFASRKYKLEQQNAGINPDAPIVSKGNASSVSPTGKFDCYNEAGWLKVEVRRLEAEVRKLSAEKSYLLQEKSTWFTKFQDENTKWSSLLKDVKVMKARMATEMNDFAHQREALRTVEINTEDRALYDLCMHQLPLNKAIQETTSGKKRMKAIELHAVLTSLVTTCRNAQAQFMDNFSGMIVDAENLHIQNMADESENTANNPDLQQNLQKLHELVNNIKQWGKNCAALTDAINDSSIDPRHVYLTEGGVGAGTNGDAGNDIAGMMSDFVSPNGTGSGNEAGLRKTIAQLRSKNAELTKSLKQYTKKGPSGVPTPTGATSPVPANGWASGNGGTKSTNSPTKRKPTNSPTAAQGRLTRQGTATNMSPIPTNEVAPPNTFKRPPSVSIPACEPTPSPPRESLVDEAYEVEREEFLDDVSVAPVPVEDASRQYAANYQEIQSLIQSANAINEGDLDVLDEFDVADDITVKEPEANHALDLYLNGRCPAYRAVILEYLQDIVCDHPLLASDEDSQSSHPLPETPEQAKKNKLAKDIVSVLYDDVSLVVSQQMQAMVLSNFSEEYIRTMSTMNNIENVDEANELLALDYLKERILPDPVAFGNFVNMALHSTSGLCSFRIFECQSIVYFCIYIFPLQSTYSSSRSDSFSDLGSVLLL